MALKQAEPDQGSRKDQPHQTRTKRSRMFGAVAAAVAIALIALFVVVAVNRDPAEPSAAAEGVAAPPVAGEDVVTPPVDVTNGYLLDLDTGETTPLPENVPETKYDVSPDGTQITFDADPDSDSKIVVADLDGSDVRTFSGDGAEVRGPAWSPDGSLIVYLASDPDSDEGVGNLFTLDVASGDTTQITDFPQEPVMMGSYLSPSFSADGTRVYYQYPRGTSITRDFWSVPVTGGEPTLVRKRATYGEVSPDGRQIAYLKTTAVDPYAGESLIVYTEGGQPPTRRTLVRGSAIQWQRWSPDGTRIAYSDGPDVFVVDVETEETSRVGDGSFAGWVDDHTLIVAS